MKERPLTWLGVGTIAAILAATAFATFASVRAERDDAHDRRSALLSSAVSDLAGAVATATAGVEGLKAVVETTGDLSARALQHVAAVPLARQPALTSLAWTRLPPGAALEAARPVIAARASSGTGAGTPLASPPSGPRPPTRATPAPRACPPPSTRPAAAGSCSWSRRSTHRAPRCPTPPPGGRALRGFVTGTLDAGVLAEELGATLPEGARLRVTDGEAPVIGDSGGAGPAMTAWWTPRAAG